MDLLQLLREVPGLGGIIAPGTGPSAAGLDPSFEYTELNIYGLLSGEPIALRLLFRRPPFADSDIFGDPMTTPPWEYCDVSVRPHKLSPARYAKAVGILFPLDSPEALAKVAEIRRLHDSLSRKAPPCPRCDVKMSLRSGRKGLFFGCARYPLCRGKANLSEEHADSVAAEASLRREIAIDPRERLRLRPLIRSSSS